MGWKKLGLVFDVRKQNIGWLKSHAMVPTPILIDDRIRVYFSGRDFQGRSRVGFVDVASSNPQKILYTHDKPILELGKLGTFDDSGTIPTCVVSDGPLLYLYYTAYNIRATVPYGNSIGLASSKDNGLSFEHVFEGPVVERNQTEPYIAVSPCVVINKDIWHLWYGSGTGWVIVNGKPESLYHIKYAHSIDGKYWVRDNVSCILPNDPMEAIARPWVIQHGDDYEMWYCYRGSADFRDGKDSYRIGYATGQEPVSWKRRDYDVGITEGPEEYDNKMQAYPAVLDVGGVRYLFYNGNGFGYNGFCCAIWE